MRRLALASILTATLAGCTAQQRSPHPDDPQLARMKDDLQDLEQDLRGGGDAVAMRCRVASLYLTLASFDGSPSRDRLDCARRALLHADAAIRLDDDRAEAHFYRAIAIGRVLELSTMPRLSLIGDLEEAGLRARELDPTLQGAGPLRLLALLYWQAPGWPIGPADAGEDEVIDALFREAIELAPTSSENRICYAEYLAAEEREDDAIQHIFAARTLLARDPLVSGFDRPDLERRIEKLMRDLRVAPPK